MIKVLSYSLDFGTSNTLLGAVTELGSVASIPLDFSNTDKHVMKSLIYTPSEHEWYFGNECYDKYLEREGEGRFFRSFKTLLSRESFEGTMIHGKKYSVEEIVARFLREVRHRANTFYQQDVTSVKVGRPVRFGDTEKSDELALKRLTSALKMAGFQNIEFEYEPVAAAKSFYENLESEQMVLVADLGGGTSDFSVVKFKNNKLSSEDILAVAGINKAGDSFDYSLMKDFVMPELGSRVKYQKNMSSVEHGISRTLLSKMCTPAIFSLINDSQIQNYVEEAMDNIEVDSDFEKIKNLENLFEERLGFDLMKEVEKCKISLSKLEMSELDYCKRGVKLKKKLKQDEYFDSSVFVLEEISSTIDEVLELAKTKASDIDFVMCTGGSVQNPLIMNEIIEKFGNAKIRANEIHASVVKGLLDKR
jgi:hypothetical chaperone protein